MRVVYQDKFVKRNDAGKLYEVGNCFAACVASILELPLNQIPNVEEFMPFEGSIWADIFKEWCKHKSYEWHAVEAEDVPTDMPYIVIGKSPRGDFNHSVIYYKGNLVHDPHPEGDGIVGEPIAYEVIRRI